VAYGVASVSGTLLAVCSCTVLPLFGGIYANGAGLGPASAFLYSGPAINVLAIVLTANVLGVEIGVARALGAVVFALVIGLLMHLIFRRSEMERSNHWMLPPRTTTPGGPSGRPPPSSAPWWPSWCSPTGARRTPPKGSGTPSTRRSGS
jgi:uncharacterized membrane protein YraQ (UPF0718 family)